MADSDNELKGYPFFSKVIGRQPPGCLVLDVYRRYRKNADVEGLDTRAEVLARVIAATDQLKPHLGSFIVRTYPDSNDIIVPPHKLKFIQRRS